MLLDKVLSEVIGKGKVSRDDVVVLAPYKLEHGRLGISDYLKSKSDLFTTDMVTPDQGKVRIGTIQSFKGLEADVVVLLGIDGSEHACSPANLYVGATRARTMLYVLYHQDCRSSIA
jgi:superfamily I DNA/RNA helicase